MRFLTTAAVLALLASAPASANELLRLYDLAQDNDTQLKAAASARDAAVQILPQTRGALLPQVNGQGTMGKVKQDITLNGVDLEGDTDAHELSVSLRQPLFDAAAWSRYQQADDRVAAAEATYRLAEQNLALRVTEAYFNLLAAADSVRFADAEKKAVERSLELAKKRFEVGLSAITDVQEAQARYDLTVAQMIEAEQALSNAQVAVAEITGRNETRIMPVKEDMPLLGPNPDSVNDWLRTAAESNYEIRLARAQADDAAQGIDISRAGHYPTLSFVGSKALAEESGLNPFRETLVDQESDTTRYGLELNVPIFAGFATQAAVNAATSTHQQRVAELEGKRRQVERTTKNAYQGVIAGVSRVKALKQAVLSNTTALEASEVGLEVGARTAIDVLNAQRELYRAQRDYARARYDYLLNILRLKSAAGTLAQKDLAEIDALLTTAAEPVAPPVPATDPDAG